MGISDKKIHQLLVVSRIIKKTANTYKTITAYGWALKMSGNMMGLKYQYEKVDSLGGIG